MVLFFTSEHTRCPKCDWKHNDRVGYYFVRLYRAAYCTVLPVLPLLTVLSLLAIFTIIPYWPLLFSLFIIALPFGILYCRQDRAISVYIPLHDAIGQLVSAVERFDGSIDERASNAGVVTIVAFVLMLAITALNRFSTVYLWATLIVSIATFMVAYYIQKIAPRFIKNVQSALDFVSLCIANLVILAIIVGVLLFILSWMHLWITLADIPFIIGLGVALFLLIESVSYARNRPILFSIKQSWYGEFGTPGQELIRSVLLAFLLSTPAFLLELYLIPWDYHALTYAILIGSSVVLFLKKDLLSSLWGIKWNPAGHFIKSNFSSIYMILLLLGLLLLPVQSYYFPADQWEESASRSPIFFVLCIFYYLGLGSLILLILSLNLSKMGHTIFRAIHYLFKGKP
jgi:hypothetical protein